MAFKMKGSPMKRNFNVEASPMKQSSSAYPWEGSTVETEKKYAEGAVPEHPGDWEALQNHFYNIDRLIAEGSTPDEAYETAKEVIKEEQEMYKDQLYKEDLEGRSRKK